MSRNAVHRYFEGFLVGGAIGFIVGLLTAPKAGSQLRQELAEGADDLLNQMNEQLGELPAMVSDKVQPIADRAISLKESVAQNASRMSNQVNVKAGIIRQSITEKAHDLGDKAAHLRDQAKCMTDAAMEKACTLREQASELTDKAVEKVNNFAGSFDASANGDDLGDSRGLVENYMGNKSGPMYMPGHKADPNSTAHSMPDAHTKFTANKPEAGGG